MKEEFMSRYEYLLKNIAGLTMVFIFIASYLLQYILVDTMFQVLVNGAITFILNVIIYALLTVSIFYNIDKSIHLKALEMRKSIKKEEGDTNKQINKKNSTTGE